MKKLFLIFAIILLFVVNTSCTPRRVREKAKEPPYKDGTYVAKLSPDDHGNFSWVKLEMKDGKITDVDYREYIIAKGEYKTEENYTKYPQSPRVQANLEKQLLEKQDVDELDMDEVSGATHTKERFKEVVNKALTLAEQGKTYKPEFKDGEYMTKGEKASHGWLPEIKIKVEEGMIVGVDYNEINVETKEKKTVDNYDYDKAVEAQGMLENRLIETQDVDEIDKISGATSTTNTFKDLAQKALKNAKK